MNGMRPLEPGEVERVRAALRVGPLGLRNLALLAIGVNAGFRISESLSLDVGDVLGEGGGLRSKVTVARLAMKGRREARSVVINPDLAAALTAYVRQRQAAGTLIRGPLFVTPALNRLTRGAAWQALRNGYVRAGLEPLGLGTHALRKTFATRIFARFCIGRTPGEAIRLTKEALGHASMDSTVHYLGFDQRDVDAAVMAVGSCPGDSA